jgi:hypothetical protein
MCSIDGQKDERGPAEKLRMLKTALSYALAASGTGDSFSHRSGLSGQERWNWLVSISLVISVFDRGRSARDGLPKLVCVWSPYSLRSVDIDERDPHLDALLHHDL